MAVLTGLDLILEENASILQGKRVGVIAHPASVNSSLEHIVDLFWEHPAIRLTTVLGPQHGARGETQDNMIEWEDFVDSRTGLPVYSLYGKTRKPTEQMLSEVDVLVCDLQDVGARYYTFVYTMALAMEACREQDKEFVVLDRPNPIGGTQLEGPVLDPHFKSFVGLYPIPVRHGMTVGELARLFNSEFGLGCNLTVIPMQGWNRDLYFESTGLPWVFPSPNMPTMETAAVYPGLCLLEGTNVSEGRGTTLPFLLSGAPWVDSHDLAARLTALGLPGALFRPAHFIPTFHKWTDRMLGGIQIHVTDRSIFKPFLTGVALTMLYRQLGGQEFHWKPPPYEYEYTLLPFDILCGTAQVRRLLESETELGTIEEGWADALERFCGVRSRYLLYG